MRTTQMAFATFRLSLVALVLLACGGTGAADDRPSTTEAAPSAGTAVAAGSRRLAYRTGPNEYALPLEGRVRQYIVYVPASYEPSRAAPVVFMFHGTHQTGGHALENSGWRRIADREGVIAVFPTAARYFLTDEGTTGTRWNAYKLAEQTNPGTPLADDVLFVREILRGLQATFTLDPRRIYASGFSSGGSFTGRLLVEMPEVFAAVGAGSGLDTGGRTPRDGVRIPAYLIVGSSDDKLLASLGLEGRSLPMEAARLAGVLGHLWAPALATLGLGPSYAAQYCDAAGTRCTQEHLPAFENQLGLTTTLTYSEGAPPGLEFRVRAVKGMGHIYSDGDRQAGGMVQADVFWQFFQSHAKP